MVTTSTADNVLKSYYLDVVSDQLNHNSSPFLDKIKHTTADVWGRDVRKAVRFGLNGGIGAGTEEGPLPAPSGNNYAQFVSTLKNLYGTIEISDKAIRASQNNEGAFVNLLNDEMEGLIKSSSFNFGRMLFGDGTGKLAEITAATAKMLTVDSTAAVAEGMIVDVYKSGALVSAGRRIKTVDRITKTVMLEGDALTDAVGCIFVVQNSYGLELTGLGAVISTSDTLYGVKRSSNLWMRPYRLLAVGDITEEKLQSALDAIEENSGSKVNFIVCSWGVRRALASALSKYRQMETMELAGGYRAVSFNGIPVVADRFCPAGTMYLLNTDDFCVHQLCDWQWLEGEDGKVLKQVAGKPVYTATLVKYAELICNRPCGQGALLGIKEA